MLFFWVAAGALAAAAAGLILLRAAGAADGGSADPAPLLYRRQLSEIDDLAERGLIGDAERKSAHAEAARRLLAATDAPAQTWGADDRARPVVLAAAAGAAGLALVLYFLLGSPDKPDQPFAKRLEAWQSADLQSLTAPEIAAVLRRAVTERPRDAEGYRLLAVVEAQSENYPAAARAFRQAVAVSPERADLWRGLGEALVFQAGGKVGSDAREAFTEALKREPDDLTSRVYLAQAEVDAGRVVQGVMAFRAVLDELPAGDPRRNAVQTMIARAQGSAIPTADPEQMAMIRGMVERLEGRLEENPDDADGWVRLVRAYAVLGDAKKRDEAYAAARARYAGARDVLSELDTAARAEPMR